MMDDLVSESKQLLEASAELLARVTASDRIRAEARLQSAPALLTEYEQDLLGDEVIRAAQAAVRVGEQQAAAERRRVDAITTALRPARIVFRTPYLAQLNAHAISVAVDLGIAVTNCGLGGRAYADFAQRCVHVPPVTNEDSYCTFLHEVGHLVSPEADSRQHHYHVRDGYLYAAPGEVAAWRWAVEQAVPGWTGVMHEHMYRSLLCVARHSTGEERMHMSLFLAWANTQAVRPWTPGELDQKRAAMLRDGDPTATTVTEAFKKQLASGRPA